MVLDMLTADAAAKHGRRCSPPRCPSPAQHVSFLAQMPLTFLNTVLRGQTPSPAPAVTSAEHPDSPAGPPSLAKPQHILMPAVSPPTSRPASPTSTVSTEGKPTKRPSRQKTIYNLAQPPPTATTRQKLHIRPKILLQLHQVIPSNRPKPVYEVIPFSLLAPRSTRRLVRAFGSKSRDKFGPHDLLVVKAEEYGNKDNEAKSDDERWGARDVVGIICPAKEEKGVALKTEVLMGDGSSWDVTNTPNGGYEFNFTDEHGLHLKSRWVPKAASGRRVSAMSGTSLASPISPPDERKFNFSTIGAQSRRHPVIATMGRANIEVLDAYAIPTATSPSTPSLSSTIPTPLTPSSIPELSYFMDKANERPPVKTDDSLRRFIVVSGIWVAFAENWSPAYSLSKDACPLPTFPPMVPHRTASMSMVDSPRSLSPSPALDENRRTIPKIFRTGTQMLQRNSSLSNTPTTPRSATNSPSSSPTVKTRSRRSNSTGAADLFSKTGSMRKRFGFGLGLESETLSETDEERQTNRSIELLRIKELAVPDPVAPPPAQIQIQIQTQTPTAPPPIQIIEPPSEHRSPSPASPDARALKTMSAYNPITTTGLWDSGVQDGGPGMSKRRPTSMVVVNEKLEKAKRKQEKSKGREKFSAGNSDKGTEVRRKSERFKRLFGGLFRREKGEA
ncbi:hypothetical protein BDV95DRAFT_583199 [Massariosphaeria phaeospora]|uniref:Uncharacterized protein n=1 Tax=Massariosphaeria phaeospora TaxID=100035 RepID=A0A7C8M3Y1_9PLEO|nr:hypothetical protein BDV95DRAFT_583199 [Massariosphaeria phaeospora]